MHRAAPLDDSFLLGIRQLTVALQTTDSLHIHLTKVTITYPSRYYNSLVSASL